MKTDFLLYIFFSQSTANPEHFRSMRSIPVWKEGMSALPVKRKLLHPRSLPIQSYFQKTAVHPQPISTCHEAEDRSRHWGLDQFPSATPTVEWSNLWPTVQSNSAVSQTSLWHLPKVVKLMKNPPSANWNRPQHRQQRVKTAVRGENILNNAIIGTKQK